MGAALKNKKKKKKKKVQKAKPHLREYIII